MYDLRFPLICCAVAALLASLVNMHQTSLISDLQIRTNHIEAALRAYNIPMPVEK